MTKLHIYRLYIVLKEGKRNKFKKPKEKGLTMRKKSDIMGKLSRRRGSKHNGTGQAQKSEKNTKKALDKGKQL